MKAITTTGAGIQEQPRAGLGLLSKMPPIYYQYQGQNKDRPDLSAASRDELFQKLMLQLTREQAEYILTDAGRQAVRDALYERAQEDIYVETGPFSDGKGKGIERSNDWADWAVNVYEEAAIAWLQQNATGGGGGGGNPGGGSGGGGGNPVGGYGGGGTTPTTGGIMAGFGGPMSLVIGLGVLAGGGIYAWNEMNK
ncbi:hypothetical protein [Salisaeta icosahedral phage 1]|uniref:hypothetical protein n=1 Tax=Salisaeta icosahedral phage 1 TaxID=1183239 RepID=UPI00025EA941|nr:hypothetical protein A322_gp52 [Salisaeta icosahedral phage 1]AFJ21507.1 hypothetical protein [Salisaeta icosahedral phage 1]